MTSTLEEPAITVRLPVPHGGQRRVIESSSRYVVVRCGRRWGKTTAGALVAVLCAIEGRKVGWFSPTYRMLLDAWRLMRDWCADITSRCSEVGHEMVLITGGVIRAYSLDNPHSARGEAFHLVVIDEAAQVSHLDVAWESAIRPTLTDYGGRAVFLSTPRIGSYFSDVLCRQTGSSWEQIHAPSWDNPRIPQDEIEEARRTLPDWVFRQEYGAELVRHKGSMFEASWFRVVREAPEHLQWVRYWDLALTTGERSSYTASVRGAVGEDGTLYLADMIRGRWEWPTCREIMVETMRREHRVLHYVESALHGRAAVQELVRDPSLVGTSISALDVDRDKVSRALVWSVRASQGLVALVDGDWIPAFLEEALAFPHGAYDDQVDAVSGVVMALSREVGDTPVVAVVGAPKVPGWRELFGHRRLL
ncbi:phage terminase large subunit [Thermogutta sp.]|uniref:phage terminase large subunit n=1 Tax=Thermogutta sp. TaxID=1962930 RepID=UPI00322020B7